MSPEKTLYLFHLIIVFPSFFIFLFLVDCPCILTPSGKIAVIGGCREYTGAPYFAAISALKIVSAPLIFALLF